jgi:prepilin-type processing-associated H-X9-DG protein/prepilin-type N-terminal cleavage/methylation domain-containing protein
MALIGLIVCAQLSNAGQATMSDDDEHLLQRVSRGWDQVARARILRSFSKVDGANGLRAEFRQGAGGMLWHLDDGKGLEMITGCNAQYRFRIVKKGSLWSLEDVEIRPLPSELRDSEWFRNYLTLGNQEGQTLRGTIVSAIDFGTLIGATSQLNSTGNGYWVDQDDFQIVSVERDNLDGNDVVRFKATWTGHGARKLADGSWEAQNFAHDGTFWCLPNCDYFPVKSEIHLAGADVTRTFDYLDHKGPGLPRIVSETYELLPKSTSGAVPVKRSWRFDQEFPTVFPDSAFRLSAYGLPEPPGIRWPAFRLYVWIGVLGIACLVAALSLRRLRFGTARLPSRAAFSLVEVLVVIAIVSVLLGIALPAIQSVRDAVRRTNCADNIRQIAIGVHNYASAFDRLPMGSRHVDDPKWPSRSWLAEILPFHEQNALHEQSMGEYRAGISPFNSVILQTPIPLYGCPSDGRSGLAQWTHGPRLVALTSYVGVCGIDRAQPSGVLIHDRAIRNSEIRDGLSQTLMVGERPASTDNWYGWWYAGVGQDDSGNPEMILGVRETNLQVEYTVDCPIGPYRFTRGRFDEMSDVFHFWSPHSGGANFAFCDGSVKFLPYEADAVIVEFATRDGHEVVGNW